MLQTTGCNNSLIPSDVQSTLPGEVNPSVLNQTTPVDNQQMDVQSQDFLHSRLDNNQSEKLFQVINQPMTVVQNGPEVEDNQNDSVPGKYFWI